MAKRTIFQFAFLFVVATACLVPGCGGGSEGSSPTVDTVVEESFTTQTADGVSIAMYRYTRSSGVAHPDPILLSQGYLEGSRVFHAFPKYSLAAQLALEGHEVWAYDIRGTGNSWQPELDWKNLYVDFSVDWTNFDFELEFGMKGWEYSNDHFVFLDTPAAIDFMLKATGKQQFVWIAHSLGALMQYAYLQGPEAWRVKSAVSMGGIGYIVPGQDYDSLFAEIFFGIGTFLAPLMPSNLPLPLKWALEKLVDKDPLKWAGVCYALDTIVGKLFWNHENMNPNLIYQFLKFALPNTTTNCFKQFMEWTKTGDCKLKGVTYKPAATATPAAAGNTAFPATTASDGTITIGKDYSVTQNLYKIKTPLLVLSGGADYMCPPEHCLEVYKRIGSKVKGHIECSKKTGHSVDYGHIDMTMGIYARHEVYPHVTNWVRPEGPGHH